MQIGVSILQGVHAGFKLHTTSSVRMRIMRSRIRVEMFSRRSPGIIVVKLEGIHLSHYACIIGISFLVHRLKDTDEKCLS